MSGDEKKNPSEASGTPNAPNEEGGKATGPFGGSNAQETAPPDVGRINDENTGKGNQDDGSSKRAITLSAETQETDEGPLSFRRLTEELDGWWVADDFSSTLLQDIVDLDLGLVIVAHRALTDTSTMTPRGAIRATRRIAEGLTATAHWSQVAGPNTPPGWDQPLRRSIERVVEEGGEARRLFAVAVDARTSDDLKFFGAEHRAARLELGHWLRARNANLIVYVGLPSAHTRRRMANVCPEFHWWSWQSWLDDLAEKTDLSIGELEELFVSASGDLLEARDSTSDLREQILHRTLRAWFSSTLDGATDEIEFRSVLDRAIRIARSGADQGVTAQNLIRRMFGIPPVWTETSADTQNDGKVEPIGDIERTVLTVWALLERVDFSDLMAVVRGLLPEGEAPLRHLTPELRDVWERGIHDDRRLRREARSRADWRAVFDARRTTSLWSAGLKCVDDLKVVERGDFEKSDVRAVLAEWPESLETLMNRVRDRDLMHRLPRSACITLVHLLASVRRQTPSLLSASDFVRMAAGLGPTDGRMSIPQWVIEDQRDLGVKFLADWIAPDLIRRLGDARAAVMAHRAAESGMAAFGEGVEDFEDELLLGTVDAFREFLRVLVGQGAEHGGFVDDCLDAVVASVDTPLHALMVISYLVIGGPAPSDARLGEATFRIVRAAVPDPDRPRDGVRGQPFFDLFDRHLARTLNSVAPSTARSVDRWADAVVSVAASPAARPWQKAMAGYMDDAIARHDIPWGNPNRRPLDAPVVAPILAPQFLGSREEDPSRIGPDLVERLFARSADEHLVRLVDFARQGDESFFAAVERRIVDLLSETYWVLSDEIDRSEVDARADVNPRLSSEIWGGITDAYGLDPVRNARGAAALLLSRIEAPRGSRDRLPIALLDLFAPTVLLHWRFRMFRPGRLSAEANGPYVACLERLRIAAGERLPEVQRAFLALATAEARLVSLFDANNCSKTAERHRDRRDRILSLADFFAAAGPPATIPASE